MNILGFPLEAWIIVVGLAIPVGIVLLYGAKGLPCLQLWLAGMAFFFARLMFELTFSEGRPDRVFGVMIMWSAYMLAMWLGNRWMDRKYHIQS